MSGHSKWSKVKHQKATTDVVKGLLFTKAVRAITQAVKEGGGIGDPLRNHRLSLAIEKAKDVNVPKDTIRRAIGKAVNVVSGSMEEVYYEGFGPDSTAILIQAITDNRTRTVSTMKHTLGLFGCSLASPGAVMHLFRRLGIITLSKENVSADAVMGWGIDGGADEVLEKNDCFEMYIDTTKLPALLDALKQRGSSIIHTDVVYVPNVRLAVSDQTGKLLSQLTEALRSLDDVEAVYTNTL